MTFKAIKKKKKKSVKKSLLSHWQQKYHIQISWMATQRHHLSFPSMVMTFNFVINSLSNFAAIYVYENNDSRSSGNSCSKRHMRAINKTTQNRFSATVTLQSWVDYYDVGGCRANGKHVSVSLSGPHVDVTVAISTPVACLCVEQRSKSAVNET